MAKIKFGMMMTDARGKLGGQVFSKNRGGAYVRTKVTPANARTVRQTVVRSLLASISQGWSGLTLAARNSFNEAVNQFSTTDIFGDIRNPSGKSLFVRLNMNLANSGQATIAAAPVKVDLPIVGFSAAEIDLTKEEINLTASGTFTNGAVVVSATAPQSAGTAFYKGKFRQIFAELAAMPAPEELYAAYVAKFGVPALGANIAIQVSFVAENGQATVPSSLRASIS